MRINTESIEKAWIEIFESTPAEVREAIQQVVTAHKTSMADAFYSRMLKDPEAHAFLNHEEVHHRLHASMQRWLESLFGCTTREQFVTALAMQRHVGEVHARIDLPINLVARGARTLKAEICKHLAGSPLDREQLVTALMSVDTIIDLAFEIMSLAYIASHERTARIDEAYRAFSSGQNMSLERERQRTALLDWENRYLHANMSGQAGDDLPRIGNSSFGLWMQHKAPVVFREGVDLEAIRELIGSIDDGLLPLCCAQLGKGDRKESLRLLREVQKAVAELRFLTESMFERMVELESGKDALTQLLNRRFLPAILTRETELARSGSKAFCVLLIDIDHFKNVNDQHGHSAGDSVLQQVALLLQNSIRSGDFAFRYGGEEFLLLLVEVDERHAWRVAEKIRQRIEQESFLLCNNGRLSATVSIGLAMYDGHPDYQRLVDRADRALYQAKQSGRNRCIKLD